eukprot:5523580-Amphidinium_carterae.1
MELTVGQRLVFDHANKCVGQMGAPPRVINPLGAHLELLKSDSIYGESGTLTVRPYQKDKLKLLHNDIVAHDLSSQAPEH